MEVLTNSTPLPHEMHLKSGQILETIGDTATFTTNLPKERDGRLRCRMARKKRPQNSWRPQPSPWRTR
jgi:hypothetical protein